MLGGARSAGWTPDGSGRTKSIGRLKSFKKRLPAFVQRRLPGDLPSGLLFVAYAWTTVIGAWSTVAAIAGLVNRGDLLVSLPVLAVGLAGLWFGASFIALIPAVVIWLLIGASDFLAGGVYDVLWGVSNVACIAAGIWMAARSVRDSQHWTRSYNSTINQLGWDLYRFSNQPPITDESLSSIVVYKDLRVGEVDRHFDQVTSGAIQGGMQHVFKLDGTSSSLHGLPQFPFLADTQSWMTLGGSGVSNVQLGMSGTARDDLTGDAFVAVMETPGPNGVDTIRAVVPSDRQARAYVTQILVLWAAQLGPNTDSELMLRRYSGSIAQAVTSETSYVGDRLNAILRMPASERPPITVIGEPLNQHAVLVGAVRFGSTGPLFQLFPIALVRALVALMQGRPLPPPPAGLPPALGRREEAGQDDDDARPVGEVAQSNGHVVGLSVRTIGGLHITAADEDLTSSLLERKVLAFLWLHLLARRLRNPQDTITRASLGDELSPGLDSSTQRSRLRGRLSEMRNQLPPALGRRVEVKGERIGLDLTDCEVDLLQILEADKSFRGANGLLSPAQLGTIESMIAGVRGTFLPDWDDLEQHVNGGRGGAGEVIADLRRQYEAAFSSLLGTVGKAYMSHGNADAAIPFLEQARELSPGDEAIGRALIAACLRAGHLERADELKKEFSSV